MAFRTQEGDVVRINFSESSYRQQAMGAAYRRDDEQESALAMMLSASGQERRFSIEVEGDLSADEMTALGEMFDRVGAMSNQFFNGDPQRAFAMAQELGYDDSQIAGFAINLAKTESRAVSVGVSTYAQVQETSGGRPQLGQVLDGLRQYAQDLMGANQTAERFPDATELLTEALTRTNELQAGLIGLSEEQTAAMNDQMRGLNELLSSLVEA